MVVGFRHAAVPVFALGMILGMGCGADAAMGSRNRAGAGGDSLPVNSAGSVSGSGAVAGQAGQGGTDFGNTDSVIPPIPVEADAAVDSGTIQVPREDCGDLLAIVRDFRIDHADFERPINFLAFAGEKNLVRPQLEMGFPRQRRQSS